MKIKNLKPCMLEEDGTLKNYGTKNLLIIKKGVYSIGKNLEQYKIENTNRIKYTDYLKTKVVDKFVYQLRKEDKNNPEIYVSLTFWQNIKFILMNKFRFKSLFKTLLKPIEWIIKLVS